VLVKLYTVTQPERRTGRPCGRMSNRDETSDPKSCPPPNRARSYTVPIPIVTVYSRPGCHLCDVVKQQLETIRRDMEFHIEERNIDEDASLRERYNDDVPVIAVNGEDVFKHRIHIGKMRDMLSLAKQENSGQ
jgi:glutaredoxin